jgi:hypothetical protein
LVSALRSGSVEFTATESFRMEQVAMTAENGRYLQPFAKIILALATRRENQSAVAQRLLFASEYIRAMAMSSHD